MTQKRERIWPVSAPVRDMIMAAARTPEGRATIEEAFRMMRAGEAKAMRRGRLGDRCNLGMPGGIVIHVTGSRVAKTTLMLAEGITLRTDTVSAKRTALPETVKMMLPGRRLDSVVETGRPEIDALTIKSVLQQGRTLSIILDVAKEEIVLEDMLQ